MFNKEKLKIFMKEYGDSNKNLAASIGMTPSNFSTIWNGRQQFQKKHMILIAVRYDLTPQDIWEIFLQSDVESLKRERLK
jgi:plasmid maintenance system antidote protein VapI